MYDSANNLIYSVETSLKDAENTDSFDGTITTIGDNVYTLVTEENEDTFKTNNNVDFSKKYVYNEEESELERTLTSDVFYTDYGYGENGVTVLENVFEKNDKGEITEGYIFNYGYENENISSETLTVESKAEDGSSDGHTESVSYEYDDNDQLTKATSGTTEWSYEYDSRGNIISKSIKDIETNDTVTYTYGYDSVWEDRLISYNGQEIKYALEDGTTDNSNPLVYRGNALTWTMGRQLASFGSNTYTYNEDGIRTSKTSNGITTKFLLDGYNVIEQTDGTTTLHFFYDSNDEVIGFRYNGNDYFYVKNAMSDIIAITDSNKNVVAEYRYDPWGKVLNEENLTVIGNLNPFRYRSYYYDNDIQMYYLQSRYYDAEVGRFINCDDVNYIGVDDTVVSYNAFAYCENNPTINWDPIGNNWLNKIKDILSIFSSFFATNTVSVFSINNNAWMSSSETMGNTLQNAAGARSCTVIPTTSNNFADEWNKMRSKYVIIHTHGDTTGIYDESDPQQAIFTTSDMNNLKRNNKIRCVIITSCSVAGNAGLLKYNFARALSKKINSNGVVVGCRFNVLGGDTFFEPAHPNTNMPQPWIVYRNGLAIDRKLPNRISMQIVYNHLVENGYI